MDRLELYRELGYTSKKALLKTNLQFGRERPYSPRAPLVKRLMKKFNLSAEEVYDELRKDRDFLLKTQIKPFQ